MSEVENAEGFLSITSAERFVGLSPTTLRRLIREGRLTVYKPTPGRLLLSRKQLRDLVENAAVGSAEKCD
jgi:predicted site-specific integrase-resolvase